jgi:methylmalonyl-CoA mutase N-terminal domain/subunit
MPVVASPDYSALEQDQVGRLADTRARRDQPAVNAALEALGDGAVGYVQAGVGTRVPLMPLIVDAVRARASVGEISDVLRARWGLHRPA